MKEDRTYDQARQDIFRACGFQGGQPRYAFVPYQSDLKLSFFDFAQSLALSRVGQVSTITLEGTEVERCCARFELLVTDLQPIALPDVQRSRNGTVIYEPNPSWIGQGQVVVPPGAQPLVVRFLIETGDEAGRDADRAWIAEIGFELFPG